MHTIEGSIRTRFAATLDAVRNPLSSTSAGRREVLLSGALLTLLALVVYMPHILHGGWYLDDWINIARINEANDPLDALSAMNDGSFRPGLAFSLTVIYLIGGESQSGYLILGAALAAAQGWLFYMVLRLVGLRTAIAAAAAAVFVVLPAIDATRLWIAAFPTQVSGSLYLLGVLAALHGVTRAHGRRAVAWHAAAAALYFAAILTYELIAGLVAVTPLLYAVKVDWRAAARRVLPDFASIALALAIIAPRGASDRDANASLGFMWDRATQILVEAKGVFLWMLPFPEMLGGPLGAIALLAGMLGVGIAIGREDEDGRGFTAWVKIAALATIFALAGLAMLLPADPYFVPRTTGLGNRTGAFAAFGGVLLLIAVIVLALGGIGVLVRQRRLGFLLALALILVTGANLVRREVRQQEPWIDSWRQQQQVVADIGRAVGGVPPPGTAIVSFRHTTFIQPADVSVFAYSWDLRGALWETYGRDLAAHPWGPGTACDAKGVFFPDGSSTTTGSSPYAYGRLLFVDVYAGRAKPIRSRRECETTLAALTG